MYYDKNACEYGDINYNINKLYCEKYGLDLILSNEKTYDDRHPAWERLPLILKHIKKYDYLIWIDADAFFYINSGNISDVINQNQNVNFIFSKDITNNNINTGIMIIKNTQFSIDFINKWAFDEELYKNNPCPHWWDQGVLISMYDKNILDIQNKQISYDYGVLQHFYEDELNFLQKQPFIFHMAGYDKIDRINESKKKYNKLINQTAN